MSNEVALVAACAAMGLLVGALLPRVVAWAAGDDVVACRPLLVVPLTGALFALLAWRLGAAPDLPAQLYVGAVGVALVVIDLAVHRLPDRLTLPSYPVVGGLLVAASLVGGDGHALIRAALAAAALYAVYFLVALAAAGGMGFGDVKLAGVLGLALGWAGWAPVVLGAFLGFLYGGLASLALLVTRRATRRTRVPFGPFMLAGALTAVCLGDRGAATMLAVAFA